MKRNLPITGMEVPFAPDQFVISATDTKGQLTYTNDYFRQISGFTDDQLIGKSHNVVRHPDMPPAAFADLWDTIKAGRPWMGMVKNRCANGDHYWVDAYVTPLLDGKQVIGYESVRTPPNREHVGRAERFYDALNKGGSTGPSWRSLGMRGKFTLGIAAVLVPVAGLAVLLAGAAPLPVAGLTALGLAAGFGIAHAVTATLREAARQSRAIVDNVIVKQVYAGGQDEVAQLQVAQKMLQSRLTTVLNRIGNSASQVSDNADDNHRRLQQSHDDLVKQQGETMQLATAMNEMVATVQEVARNTEAAAKAAGNANGASNDGKRVVKQLVQAISRLADNVQSSTQAIVRLSQESENIDSVVEVINSIAEQTNLLALNAAIEAARAGEQGRGFAVVADEVRTLASRTQDSTQEIRDMIDRLQGDIRGVVSTMEDNLGAAQGTVDQAQQADAALQSIADAVSQISDMNTQIAGAAEEQSMVAEEINRNISMISDISESTSSNAQASVQGSRDLTQVAEQMKTLLRRFSA